eukprot:2563130-Amphidinium_carterae.1
MTGWWLETYTDPLTTKFARDRLALADFTEPSLSKLQSGVGEGPGTIAFRLAIRLCEHRRCID